MDLPDDIVSHLVVLAGFHIEAAAIAGRIEDWAEMARGEILEVSQGKINLSDADFHELGGRAMSEIINGYVSLAKPILEAPEAILDKASIDDDFEELQRIGNVLSSVLKEVVDKKLRVFDVDVDAALRTFSDICDAYKAQMSKLQGQVE